MEQIVKFAKIFKEMEIEKYKAIRALKEMFGDKEVCIKNKVMIVQVMSMTSYELGVPAFTKDKFESVFDDMVNSQFPPPVIPFGGGVGLVNNKPEAKRQRTD
jgi:hypothetical protein